MANGHGGARAGAGRKKGGTNSGERKNERVVLCCTKEQAEILKQQAASAGLTVSSYILSRLFPKKISYYLD